MTPVELAALLIAASTQLKAAGMTLDKDPSENFSDLATLVSIAYAENEQGENIGTGQSVITDEQGKREVSFGPFQINEFWYEDKSDANDVTLVNNEYTDIFNNASEKDMITLLQDPMNSAIAAVIVANSIKGYENWSVYNKPVYGIKEQNLESKYWSTGFNSAAEKMFTVPTNNDVGSIDMAEPTQESGGLGMERRREGYADREVSNFNRAVERVAKMVNPTDPTNEETIRQVQLSLSDLSIEDLPQPARSNYEEVDKAVINFVAELGRQKAGLK